MLNNRIDERAPFRTLRNCSAADVFAQLPTPSYVIDEHQLKCNGQILAEVIRKTGCHILLAQKAFSNFDFYPMLSEYVSGTEASGLYEARLGYEEMGDKEVHVFCGAYRKEEFDELLKYADHIVFNSIHQLEKFGKTAKQAGKSIGLRINPECSTQEGHEIYDPCSPGSRLGVTLDVWKEEMTEELLSLLDGLHFHTLCEQNSDALKTTLKAVSAKFGSVLKQMKWINMGGGHHITRDDYDLDTLIECIEYAEKEWDVEVYLEPGEAVALNAGYLVSRVLDIIKNGNMQIAILDSSAACHMPDVIEMPYTPPCYNATTEKTEMNSFHYRLGGPTCLSGDVIGDYYFCEPLKEGDLLVFGDMAIYTTCKNNTFNGMPLPDIWSMKEDTELEQLTGFGYQDFKGRLGKIK